MPADDFTRAMTAGAAAIRAGDVASGIAAYEAAVATRPDAADAWFNLGYLRRNARQFQPALDAYARAIGADVARPEDAMLNRAAILSDQLGRDGEARDELRRALAIAPAFVTAWLNLGVIEEDAGDAAAARMAYTAALRHDPANGRAVARLVALDAVADDAAAGLARAARALATPLPAADRAEILFAQAGVLDARGDHAAAFIAADEANRLTRDDMRRQGFGYDARAQERTTLAWPAMPPLPSAPPTAAVPVMVFICGMFRSGSTLLEGLLARHSRIAGCGELETIPAFAARIADYPRGLARLTPAELGALRDAYLRDARAVAPGAPVLIDKRPDNFQHIGLIRALFPDAKIIETQRDPRDIVVSSYFLPFAAGVPYGFDLGELAHWYGQYRRLIAHWRASDPQGVHRVRYEQLVADPERELRAAVAFIGLDWEPGLVRRAPVGGVIRTASMWQVRRPINTASVGRWRHYVRELASVLPLLQD